MIDIYTFGALAFDSPDNIFREKRARHIFWMKKGKNFRHAKLICVCAGIERIKYSFGQTGSPRNSDSLVLCDTENNAALLSST